jgi:hypothetical protein
MAAGACLALTACVTNPPRPALGTALPPALARLPNVLPLAADAPAARFLVRSTVPAGQHAALVQLTDHDNCKLPNLAAVAARSDEAPSTATLPAGRPMTLDFLVADGTRAICVIRWGLTPVPGRQYLVQGGSAGSVCAASLWDVSQPDRPRTPDDLRYRAEAGKPCVPTEQARRVQPGLLEGGQVDGEAVLRPGATDEPLKGLIRR